MQDFATFRSCLSQVAYKYEFCLRRVPVIHEKLSLSRGLYVLILPPTRAAHRLEIGEGLDLCHMYVSRTTRSWQNSHTRWTLQSYLKTKVKPWICPSITNLSFFQRKTVRIGVIARPISRTHSYYCGPRAVFIIDNITIGKSLGSLIMPHGR